MQATQINLEQAIGQVRNDGYVVFNRALPQDLLEEMHASFLRLLVNSRGRGVCVPIRTGSWSQCRRKAKRRLSPK